MTDAVDLTSAAVDLTVEADLDAGKGSRSHKRSADEGDAAAKSCLGSSMQVRNNGNNDGSRRGLRMPSQASGVL